MDVEHEGMYRAPAPSIVGLLRGPLESLGFERVPGAESESVGAAWRCKRLFTSRAVIVARPSARSRLDAFVEEQRRASMAWMPAAPLPRTIYLVLDYQGEQLPGSADLAECMVPPEARSHYSDGVPLPSGAADPRIQSIVAVDLESRNLRELATWGLVWRDARHQTIVAALSQ